MNTNCVNCGAPVNYRRPECEYCDTPHLTMERERPFDHFLYDPTAISRQDAMQLMKPGGLLPLRHHHPLLLAALSGSNTGDQSRPAACGLLTSLMGALGRIR